jgi:hypothetical protein
MSVNLQRVLHKHGGKENLLAGSASFFLLFLSILSTTLVPLLPIPLNWLGGIYLSTLSSILPKKFLGMVASCTQI